MKMKWKGLLSGTMAAALIIGSAFQADGMSLTEARNMKYSSERSPSATEMWYDPSTKQIVIRETATSFSYQNHEDGITHIGLRLNTWDFEVKQNGKSRALQQLYFEKDTDCTPLEYYMTDNAPCTEEDYAAKSSAFEKMTPISLEEGMRPLTEGYQGISMDDLWFPSLQSDYVRVLVGQSIRLPSGILPAKDAAAGVTYESSDPSVLQVFDNGTAVGLKSGICTVGTYVEGISEPVSEVKINVMSLQEIDYIFPKIARRLTEEDVKGLTSEQIDIAINEIYARHDLKYTEDTAIGRYIRSKSWYSKDSEKTMEEAAEHMSKEEGDNLKLLSSYRS